MILNKRMRFYKIFLLISSLMGMMIGIGFFQWNVEMKARQHLSLPGGVVFSKEKTLQLRKAYLSFRKKNQVFSTSSQEFHMPLFLNRLVFEKSPYLLQHATNPVNWYPWGKEALEKAQKEHKPIFLSIGYSTCHWCHVMEQESFENETIASVLNKYYVAIKVDREERPDLDDYFMQFVLAMRGSGGWPMNLWLTEKGRPFFGGTYFPPFEQAAGGAVGLKTLLEKLAFLYQKQPHMVLENAQKLFSWMKMQAKKKEAHIHPKRTLMRSEITSKIQNFVTFYLSQLDDVYGGVRGAPKFPSSFPLSLFLKWGSLKKETHVLMAAKKTLFAMARGGIWDVVGGGFHRYSTDPKWFVPHFEKMLYDQALLAQVYLEGYRVFKEPFFLEVVRDVFSFVFRELYDQKTGLFFSALDADSLDLELGRKKEGAFYLWKWDELKKTLSPSEWKWLQKWFDLSRKGNFEGKILLSRKKTKQFPSALWNKIRFKLLAFGKHRPHPFRDEKAIVSWNALFISALVQASWVFPDQTERERYLSQAKRAFGFIKTHLFSKNGHLLRVYRLGSGYQKAFLADYVYLIEAGLALFRRTLDEHVLTFVLELEKALEQRFWDQKSGGGLVSYVFHKKKAVLGKVFEGVVAEKGISDQVLPAPNAVAIKNWIQLYELLGKPMFLEKAQKSIQFFWDRLEQQGVGESFFKTLLFWNSPRWQVVAFVPSAEKWPSWFFKTYLEAPVFSQWIFKKGLISQKKRSFFKALGDFSWLFEKGKHEAGMALYFCQKGRCLFPVTDLKIWKKTLKEAFHK